jgi:integrase
MTPHTSSGKKGWGTLMIDRRFRGVGRVKVPTGTHDVAEWGRINAFLTTCYPGRIDLLRGLTGGRNRRLYTLPELWTAFHTHGLDRLPTAETLQALQTSARSWAKGLPAGEHRRKIESTIERLVHLDPAARIHDLPELLRRDRDRSNDRIVAFNRARSHMSAFLRDLLGADHRLYQALRAVPPLKPAKKQAGPRAGRPLEANELEAVIAALGGAYGEAARAMADTSMGPKEYWEDGFEALPDRVLIHGEKREGRDRFVPRLGQVPAPRISRSGFEQRLKRVMKNDRKRKEPQLPRVTPYAFRRTFAHTMELAGIPRTRRRLYMGHGPRDVTDLYEEHEIVAFLQEDAERILAHLGKARQMSMRLA